MRPSAAIQYVRHIATLGLQPFAAVAAMVDALEYVVPARTRVFMWIDDNLMPYSLYEAQPIPAALEGFVTQTPLLAMSDEPSIDKLLRVPAEYNGWMSLISMPNWNRSIMKNELFRAYGIGNNIDFPIRQNGTPKGLLTINREPGSASYKRGEIDAILSLRPFFLHAMAAPDISEENAKLEDGIALVRIARNGGVLEVSAGSEMVLAQLHDIERPGFNFRCDQAPEALLRVANKLRVVRSGHGCAVPAEEIRSLWGRFSLRAHLMQADGSVTVSVQSYVPETLRRWKKLANLSLSPAERRIALSMCGHAASDLVAKQCGITPASYRQYTRRIYNQLDITGRDALRQQLDN
ncbi:MAG: helix-turn-helix transcriptional regulator [Sphingorhabdus sp.]